MSSGHGSVEIVSPSMGLEPETWAPKKGCPHASTTVPWMLSPAAAGGLGIQVRGSVPPERVRGVPLGWDGSVPSSFHACSSSCRPT
ncbi:hypothetical protein VZQ01_24455 [Myxococcus faecalis]|uniref:hypothetical protein n=1 Tax=Myxococcus faecalis TaxID=3115646 RepID=UPI003CF0F799